METLTSSLAQKDEKIEALTQENRRQAEQISKLTGEVIKVTGHASGLEEVIKRERAENEGLRTKVETAESRMREAADEIDDISAQLSSIAMTAEDVERERDHYKKMYEATRKKEIGQNRAGGAESETTA